MFLGWPAHRLTYNPNFGKRAISQLLLIFLLGSKNPFLLFFIEQFFFIKKKIKSFIQQCNFDIAKDNNKTLLPNFLTSPFY